MIVHLLDQAGDLVAQDLDGDGVHGQARAQNGRVPDALQRVFAVHR